MKRIKRPLIGLILVVAVLLVVSGCGTSGQTSPPINKDKAGEQSPNASGDNQGGQDNGSGADQAKQNKTETMTGYYTNADLTELVAKEITITYPLDKAQDKYLSALDALKTAPDQSLEPLLKGWSFNGVSLASDGQLNVDISGNNDYNYGSTGEDFAIKAITKTLFQFPEVKQIQLLVDGKQVESLMGHVDTSQPFKRES